MELRPYQEKAKKRIFEEWNQGHKKTLLVQATGTGKTIVFANVIKEILLRSPVSRVLILAHIILNLQNIAKKHWMYTNIAKHLHRQKQ